MAIDTVVVIAVSYESVDDAVADYDALRALWASTTLGDTYDAAVIHRGEGGKVDIVRRHEEPTLQGTLLGGGVGVALGALTALFPAVGLAAGLLVGGAAGAGIGAVAGHVAGGFTRSDLKELGEALDEGTAGLVAVVAQDSEARVEQALTRGRRLLKKQLRADEKALERAIDDAGRAGD